MASKVCVIFGAGEKIGYSLARKFAGNGYKVVVSRRSEIAAGELSKLGSDVSSIPCDVTNQESVQSLVQKVEKDIGPIHTAIYNPGAFVFKTWETVSVEEFERSFNVNVKGLLLVSKAVCPGMVARGEGVLGITGATASLRGKPFTTAFASSKAAQRMLAQSLARDLGPKGVHVFYTIIDGQVRVDEEGYMQPDDIAETYWNISNQKKTAWTFEADMRPYGENW